ncbi:MAG: anthranilate synthase component I family protein [Spirochaetales bacterium]|nr:anthranilate synthase component I family protein [Spirochaetales bacterium]
MSNLIKSYSIISLDYEEPYIFFNNIERDFMPTMLTGDGPKDITKESYIGIKPFKRVIFNNYTFWDELRNLVDSCNFHKLKYPVNRLGGIGFISYEALHSIEKIEKKTYDLYELPIAEWILYNRYYYFNHEQNQLFQIDIEYETQNQIIGTNYNDTGFKVNNLTPDYSKTEYIDNVIKVQEKIISGDVYEVNLTQSILGDFSGSPYSLFKKLYSINKSPFSAYMERPEYSIISNSPELFLKAEKSLIETRPIKGTCKRGISLEEDNLLEQTLLDSSKNQAELFMIIDLMRNDLSRVSKVGSVKVLNKKIIEKYKNVHHLVGIVQSELEDNKDYIDLFKATFPGGSITGCPKVSCMKLTEEIEKSSRNIYTGSIFIMNKELLNSSIVIRTAIVQNNKIILNSGGAITIDSDPLEEYEETLVKLDSLFKAVGFENKL